MKVLYIANAFSLQMLFTDTVACVRVDPISLISAREEIDSFEQVVSCVGHPDTASVYSKELEFEVVANRAEIKLDSESTLLVGQINGRLPAGTTELPPDITIQWFRVNVMY